ncbi:MAG: hypothetical protein WBD46_16115 [Acidobacteriaceae bacterium]
MPATERKAPTRWTVTRESFARLLLKLGSNPGDAGARYEALRKRLIFYFTRKGLDFTEDLADEVLDRLTRRLAEGVAIGSAEAFALGIARHVAQEQFNKSLQTEGASGGFFDNIPAPSATSDVEARIAGMERCLQGLPRDDAALLESYYLGNRDGNLIRARRGLAQELGLAPAVIRQRVFFIRRRLRKCMERDAEKSDR